MQDILALATNYGQWDQSMRYAAELAVLCDAGLTGIFVSEPIVPMASPMGMPVAFPEMYVWSADVVREACAAEPAFVRWARTIGVKQPEWRVAQGQLSAALENAGNWHDVLVLGVGGDSPTCAVGVLGQILLTCGLPCLVVPESMRDAVSLNTVAIAWNGSAESVRAVHAALPLLKRAQRVELICGERLQPYAMVELSAAPDIETYLKRHAIVCSRRTFATVGENDAMELLHVAKDEIRADLLVMGAYGHSRFSEWVLGGATRYMLSNSPLPLFMRH